MSRELFRNTENSKFSIIVLIIFILSICLLLVALLLRSGVFGDPSRIIGPNPLIGAETAISPDQLTAEAKAKPVKDSTPTPSPTVSPKSTSTPSPTSTSTAIPPTHTPTPEPTTTPTSVIIQYEIRNLLKNGDFEVDFATNGVGLYWTPFHNGGAKVLFSAESSPFSIHRGITAQRLTLFEATQLNRQAGIYQQVDVVPGYTYYLTLHGQIRSQAGDVAVSQYGYRLYYSLDSLGRTNWQLLPEAAWVELPWDEQKLDDNGVQFLEYRTSFVPPRSPVTLFVRAQNKWPDPVEAHYTLDTLSLVGPHPQPVPVLINQSLPETGENNVDFITDPRFWAGLLFIGLLLITTLWRIRQRAGRALYAHDPYDR